MYLIERSSAFVRGVKRCKSKHWDMKLLKEGIRVLEASDKKTIPSRFNDHRLGGKYRGCREIHLGGRSSDWLVVYKIDQGMVVLLATGKHDEIF